MSKAIFQIFISSYKFLEDFSLVLIGHGSYDSLDVGLDRVKLFSHFTLKRVDILLHCSLLLLLSVKFLDNLGLNALHFVHLVLQVINFAFDKLLLRFSGFPFLLRAAVFSKQVYFFC